MTEEEFDQRVGELFTAIEAATGVPIVSLDGFYQIAIVGTDGRATVNALAAEHEVGINWHESLVADTAVVSLALPAGI